MKKYDYAGWEGLLQGNWKQHNLRKPLLMDTSSNNRGFVLWIDKPLADSQKAFLLQNLIVLCFWNALHAADGSGQTAGHDGYGIGIVAQIDRLQHAGGIAIGVQQTPQGSFQGVHHIAGTFDFLLRGVSKIRTEDTSVMDELLLVFKLGVVVSLCSIQTSLDALFALGIHQCKCRRVAWI